MPLPHVTQSTGEEKSQIWSKQCPPYLVELKYLTQVNNSPKGVIDTWGFSNVYILLTVKVRAQLLYFHFLFENSSRKTMAPKKVLLGKAIASKASSKSSTPQSSKAKKQSSPKPRASVETYPPRYPQCLREAKQVNQYFIPIVNNLTNFVLGPIYFPTVPGELPTYYPVNFDEPLLLSLSGLHRTGWSMKGTIRS